jgi:hypothetical protein
MRCPDSAFAIRAQVAKPAPASYRRPASVPSVDLRRLGIALRSAIVFAHSSCGLRVPQLAGSLTEADFGDAGFLVPPDPDAPNDFDGVAGDPVAGFVYEGLGRLGVRLSPHRETNDSGPRRELPCSHAVHRGSPLGTIRRPLPWWRTSLSGIKPTRNPMRNKPLYATGVSAKPMNWKRRYTLSDKPGMRRDLSIIASLSMAK